MRQMSKDFALWAMEEFLNTALLGNVGKGEDVDISFRDFPAILYTPRKDGSRSHYEDTVLDEAKEIISHFEKDILSPSSIADVTTVETEDGKLLSLRFHLKA